MDLDAVSSCSTLRQRLDQLAEMPGAPGSLLTLKEESMAFLERKKVVLTLALHNLAPLDVDVSPFDKSKGFKEKVSRTYKGLDGFSPILAYIGGKGYRVNVELRPGKQHCQKGPPAFLREMLILVR